MKPGRHLTPLEQRGHNEVHARAAGVHLLDLTKDTVATDEILGHGPAHDFSHRVRAAQGGTYRPANGIAVSRGVHEWLDANRGLAVAGGWQLESYQNEHDEPAWLARPWPAWWFIEDRLRDGPHVLVLADEQPVRPRLPFERPDVYAAFLASEQLKIA